MSITEQERKVYQEEHYQKAPITIPLAYVLIGLVAALMFAIDGSGTAAIAALFLGALVYKGKRQKECSECGAKCPDYADYCDACGKEL